MINICKCNLLSMGRSAGGLKGNRATPCSCPGLPPHSSSAHNV